MRDIKNAPIMLGVFFVLLFLLTPEVGQTATVSSSLNVSVSAIVPAPQPPEEPITAVQFTGFGYPNSELTLERNGTFLATISTDSNAFFDLLIEMDPGTYTFSIYGEDADGRMGPVFNISVTLTSGATSTITGIFLGPTIEADKTSVQIGDTIIFSGITIPNSNLNLFITSEAVDSHAIISDSNGFWSKSLIAGEDLLTLGNHEARARTTSDGGDISEYSNSLIFIVTEADEPPPTDPCEYSSPADLNCDGYVNLIDFNILMYYWEQNQPANIRADINRDGIVNIIDFSIMMFYWTG